MVQTKLQLSGKNITIYFRDYSQNNPNTGIGRKDGEFIEMTSTVILIKNTNGIIEGIPIHNIVRFIEKPGGQR